MRLSEELKEVIDEDRAIRNLDIILIINRHMENGLSIDDLRTELDITSAYLEDIVSHE